MKFRAFILTRKLRTPRCRVDYVEKYEDLGVFEVSIAPAYSSHVIYFGKRPVYEVRGLYMNGEDISFSGRCEEEFGFFKLCLP